MLSTFTRNAAHLIPYIQSYKKIQLVCEQFSRMTHVKSKTRTRITDQHLEYTLSIATSNIDANIDKLVKGKHCQVSHWHCKKLMFSSLSYNFSSIDCIYLSWTRLLPTLLKLSLFIFIGLYVKYQMHSVPCECGKRLTSTILNTAV
jgi:hypothetical protein